MSDPFIDAARKKTAGAEKAARDAADPNTSVKVQARIAARAQVRAAAQRPEPGYPWPKKFYEP